MLKYLAIFAATLTGPVCGWCEEAAPKVLQLEPVSGRPHPPVVTALAYSATTQTLAAAGDDHAIRLVSLPEGTLLRVLAGHEDWVRSLDYSLDGSMLVSAGNDARVLLWRRDQDWNPERRESEARAVACARFDLQGRTIATVGFRPEVYLMGTSSGQSKLQCGCTDMRTIAFTSDGSQLLCAGRSGDIHVVKTLGLTLTAEYPMHRARVRQVECLPNSNMAVSCAEDGTLVAFDIASGQKRSTTHIPGCKLHCLTPLTARLVATGGTDNLLHIVDIEQGKILLSWKGHTGSVAALARCGEWLASASYDTTLRLWDLKQLQPITDRIAVEPSTALGTEAKTIPTVTPR